MNEYDFKNIDFIFNCHEMRDKIISYLPDYISVPQFILQKNENHKLKIGMIKWFNVDELNLFIALVFNFGYQIYKNKIIYDNITPRFLDTLVELELKKEIYEMYFYYIYPLKNNPYYNQIKFGSSLSLLSCVKRNDLPLYNFLKNININWDYDPTYIESEDIRNYIKMYSFIICIFKKNLTMFEYVLDEMKSRNPNYINDNL